jgi:mRNA interferase HigB
MHTIARPTLNAAMKRHPSAAAWLKHWWKVAGTERWQNLQAVRGAYPATDQVDCCLVFDVRGNRYRLICQVTYANQWQRGTLLVKHFLTHAEYDKDAWQEDCK